MMALRQALGGRKNVLCFGAGKDSTALIMGLRAVGVMFRIEAIENSGLRHTVLGTESAVRQRGQCQFRPVLAELENRQMQMR